MERFRQSEIESILKLFEKELATLDRLTKIEKMKIRRKVANSILPALAASNSEPDAFLSKIELKLRDVINLFLDGWGFRENLRQQVSIIQKSRKESKKKQTSAADPADDEVLAGGESSPFSRPGT